MELFKSWCSTSVKRVPRVSFFCFIYFFQIHTMVNSNLSWCHIQLISNKWWLVALQVFLFLAIAWIINLWKIVALCGSGRRSKAFNIWGQLNKRERHHLDMRSGSVSLDRCVWDVWLTWQLKKQPDYSIYVVATWVQMDIRKMAGRPRGD